MLHAVDADYALMANWCPMPDATTSPLMQGQAAVAARLALNKAAHAADAPKHDYITYDGSSK